jgi:two-component system, OmpR family, response regulator ChvI
MRFGRVALHPYLRGDGDDHSHLRKRLLIVDDEIDVASAFKLSLTSNGYDVDVCTDADEAISTFSPGKYDLVLLDIRMPKKNGFEVYREIKKKDKDAKVCFLTAFEIYKSEFDKLFPELDVRYFLRKPISTAELKKKIEEMTR